MKKKLLSAFLVSVTIFGSAAVVSANNEKEENHRDATHGKKFELLQQQINTLQDQIKALSLGNLVQGVVGPQGLTGSKGDQGVQGVQGVTGPKGDTGPQGINGTPGVDGMTVYELAVQNGYTGTETEWLLSLVGPKGEIGVQGIQGPKGDTGPVGPPGANALVYELVGHSNALLGGGEGIMTMTEACQEVFPDSRVCTSKEILESTSFGSFAPPSGKAWVQPTQVPFGFATGAVGSVYKQAMDMSGISAPDLSCGGWVNTATNATGLAVDSAGRFSAQSCAGAFQSGVGTYDWRVNVSCCAVLQ